MNESTLRAGLDACLLTPKEMAAGQAAWLDYDDPFGDWSTPASAEHDHAPSLN